MIDAQGETLKAWVVKLLGGLSESVWGPCCGRRYGESLKAWVVKLLGGLSASTRAHILRKVVGVQEAWVV